VLFLGFLTGQLAAFRHFINPHLVIKDIGHFYLLKIAFWAARLLCREFFLAGQYCD
jgi:hypothetical protein